MGARSSFAAFCAATVVIVLACERGERLPQVEQPVQPESPSGLGPKPGGPTPAPTPSPTPSEPETPTTPAPEEPAPETPTPEPEVPPAPEFTRVLWVAPGGNDAAAGTEAAPWRTVAKALAGVRPGEAIFLKSGTYSERLKLEERGGSASQWLTLKAAPGATPVLKGGTGSATSLIDVRGAYWRIEGLTVDVAGDRAFAVLWRGAGAHHGVLRGSTLKSGTNGAGANVAESASDILIEGNTIFDFDRSGDDSHGVIVQTTARNVVVRGNDIHHNSGDGVQCIGPEGGATIAGTPFDNLLVEGNLLHDNHENGVDIKTCTRVTLRGNRIWGHHVTGTSKGEGVVVHLSARDVTVEDNEFFDNGRAISIGGVREGPPPTHVIVRRNLVRDGGRVGTDEGMGIRVGTSIDVAVQHNTLWNLPGVGLDFGRGDSGPSQGLDVRNNVLAGCGTVLRAGSGRAGAVVDANLYSGLQGAARFVSDGVNTDLTGWRVASGLDRRSREGVPGFVDAAAGDFRLSASSPARDAGLSLGLPFCGAGPDLGARESDCP
ncbi:right-handed parallel beta-helix repeat-containing protein [Myxococcaceae bacterium GXIMD 01537]